MSKAILLAGLGFGDEGKGTITEYLVDKYNAHTVVRYNGGAQAAHNVVTNDGRHHTFSQFGSGTLLGARTYLSRFMLVDPLALMAEARHLTEVGVANPYGLIAVDPDALIITPWARAANRILERSRGDGKHGSVGVGVGQTQSDFIKFGRGLVLTVGDLKDKTAFIKKSEFIRDTKITEVLSLDHGPEEKLFHITPQELWERYQEFKDLVLVTGVEYLAGKLQSGVTVFEGAQGVLIDQDYGFQPYTTWTDITFANAMALLKYIGFSGEIEKIGVTRSYSSRHGAGPMVTEDPSWGDNDERFNRKDDWQGKFRTGPLDLVALRYAIDVIGGVDSVAVTHMDKVRPIMCHEYDVPDDQDTSNYFEDTGRIKVRRPFDMRHQEKLTEILNNCAPLYKAAFKIDHIRHATRAPISVVSYGPSLHDKQEA